MSAHVAIAEVESQEGTVSARPTRLRAEHADPHDIVGSATPRLSWIVVDAPDGWTFDRYQIDSEKESATVSTEASTWVEWPLEPLVSGESRRIRIRLGDAAGAWGPWSDALDVEAGLLQSTDWVARFISPRVIGGLGESAPRLWRRFVIERTPRRARLFISAHGIYEAEINGSTVGPDVLAPGWTAYSSRLRYQRYDVTAQIRAGENEISAVLGNGWYRGQLVWPGNRAVYGDRLALVAQLVVEYDNGATEIIATDDTWLAIPSQVRADDLYDGEWRDLTGPVALDVRESSPVDVINADLGRLVVRRGPAPAVTEEVRPARLLRSPSGKTIIDFGQNLVGWVRIDARGGERGQVVTVRHAETLEGGELAIRPLRSAKATATYTLSGRAREELRPSLTFFGFRYAQIDGLPGVRIEDVRALVVGSAMERTGWFETSDERLNRLHSNIVWSMRGNFLDLPTDCPQRDERLGWTGDIQVFAPTASFLYDVSGFLSGWLEDLAAEQHADGGVPYVVPDVLRDAHATAAGWGDAATVVPMSLWTAYADDQMLERQYCSMRAWVDKVRRTAGPTLLWTQGPQFGDWLDPTAPADDPSGVQADPAVVATAYFARSAALLANAARELDRVEDALFYERLAGEIRSAFRRAFVSGEGIVRSDCQTVYALALCWDLIEDSGVRSAAGRRLSTLVQEAECRVATGFLGTPLILDALCVAGREDLAFGMLLQRGVPSWLYAVDQGATTVWERWDALLPDGTVNPGEMTSFNHYAYGAVADWMHRSIGGIAPTGPGWREFRVAPKMSSHLTRASVGFRSPHGMIESSWRREGSRVTLEVTVPYGTRASVLVPGASSAITAGPGRHRFIGHQRAVVG